MYHVTWGWISIWCSGELTGEMSGGTDSCSCYLGSECVVFKWSSRSFFVRVPLFSFVKRLIRNLKESKKNYALIFFPPAFLHALHSKKGFQSEFNISLKHNNTFFFSPFRAFFHCFRKCHLCLMGDLISCCLLVIAAIGAFCFPFLDCTLKHSTPCWYIMSPIFSNFFYTIPVICSSIRVKSVLIVLHSWQQQAISHAICAWQTSSQLNI